mmetsp:Transcript_27368/g.87900  ORF Transcript_27368/g.87900 Transcript_27368/m.87900 type:complete len:214 (+) Transcript_27368:599-1240(+)
MVARDCLMGQSSPISPRSHPPSPASEVSTSSRSEIMRDTDAGRPPAMPPAELPPAEAERLAWCQGPSWPKNSSPPENPSSWSRGRQMSGSATTVADGTPLRVSERRQKQNSALSASVKHSTVERCTKAPAFREVYGFAPTRWHQESPTWPRNASGSGWSKCSRDWKKMASSTWAAVPMPVSNHFVSSGRSMLWLGSGSSLTLKSAMRSSSLLV